MSTDKTYNGWTNYETWAVELWLDNEEGTQRYWEDTSREVHKWAGTEEARAQYRVWSLEERRRFVLADRLKEELEVWKEEEGEKLPGMLRDLLGAAFSEVNWEEIASSYMDGIEEPA